MEDLDKSYQLFENYKDLFVSQMSLDPWALFGDAEGWRDPQVVLKEHMESLWRKFGSDKRFSSGDKARVRVRMEGIVRESPQYTPEQVLVGSKGSSIVSMALGQSEQVAISQQMATQQQAQVSQEVQQQVQQEQQHEVDQQLQQQMDEAVQQSLPPARSLSEKWAPWDKVSCLANLNWLVATDPAGPVDLKKVSFLSVPSYLRRSAEFAPIANQFTPTMYWTSNSLGIYTNGTLALPYSDVQQPMAHLLLIQRQNGDRTETSSIALTQEEAVDWNRELRKAQTIHPNLKFGVYDLVHQKIIQTTSMQGLTEEDLFADTQCMEDIGRWGYLAGYTTVYRAPHPAVAEKIRHFMSGWIQDKSSDMVNCFLAIRKRFGVEPYAKSQMEAMMIKALRVDPFTLHRAQRFSS